MKGFLQFSAILEQTFFPQYVNGNESPQHFNMGGHWKEWSDSELHLKWFFGLIFVAIFARYSGHEIVGACVRPRSERAATVGRLSDPINSQGVNKQLTAAMGKRGKEGERERERDRGNRFSVPLPLVAAWLGSRGKRRAALGVRRKERQSAMRSAFMLRRLGTGCAKWRKSDL